MCVCLPKNEISNEKIIQQKSNMKIDSFAVNVKTLRVSIEFGG